MSKKQLSLLTVVFSIGLLLCFMCGIVVVLYTPTPASTTLSPTQANIVTSSPINTAVFTLTTNPNLINPGTYIVNVDIQPGIYKGEAGSDVLNSCYWERLRDLTGNFDAILANDIPTGQFYVRVLPSDFALKTTCALEWAGP